LSKGLLAVLLGMAQKKCAKIYVQVLRQTHSECARWVSTRQAVDGVCLPTEIRGVEDV
jgi:hypothetical protein